MPTAPTPVPALPTPTPSRLDPVNFRSRMDARLAADPAHTDAMNALSENVYENAVEAVDAAGAALASQNAAATSATNASNHKVGAQQAQAAAEAAAIAAGSAAGLPSSAAAAAGRVLRVENSGPAWKWPRGAPRHVRATPGAHNRITSSARMGVDLSAWTVGAGVASVAGGYGGDNGVGFVRATVSTAVAAFIAQTYTPVNGASKTFSVGWRGAAKPASGLLLSITYRDAGGTLQTVSLPFTDASVIADGKWRRYSVTAAHASATTTGCAVAILDSAPAGIYDYCDPQLNDGTSALEVVCVDTALPVDSGNVFHIDTTGGAVTLYPTPSPDYGDPIGIVDVGGVCETNNITINYNGVHAINGLAESMGININRVSVELCLDSQKGWVTR